MSPCFLEAKRKELESFKVNKVFNRVAVADLPPKTQLIDTRWVCTWKDLGDGHMRMAKARLVAKGFQERIDPDEAIDAPTATREGVRLVAFIAAQHQWRIGSIDVKTAFLQADERESGEKLIAVRPPKEAEEDAEFVWILAKSMYGLRSAPKAWWKTLVKALVTEFGFQQCVHDQAVFTFWSEDRLCGALAIHVDDILFAGNDKMAAAMKSISNRFAFGSQKFDNFIHLGIEIKSSNDLSEVSLGQESYIAVLSPIELGPSRAQQTDSPLTSDEQHRLRMLTGGIMWIAGMTRPDISVDASMLAGKLHRPTVQDVLTANKIVRYLKGSSTHVVVYRKMKGPLRVLAYSDSAFQNLDQGRSQAGHLVMIAEEDSAGTAPVSIQAGDATFLTRDIKVALMSWKSSRHRRVVRSTFSAELLASTNSFDSASWFASLFAEMTTGVQVRNEIPIDLRTDCENLVANTKSLRIQATEKRLYGEIWALREALESSEIRTFKHVPTVLMVADGLTKIQPKLRFKLLSAIGGQVSVPAHLK